MALFTEQLMAITSPFGDDLRFERLHAREELGRLSEFRISALSLKESLSPRDILGRHVTVTHNGLDAGPRHYDGCAVRFGLAGMEGRFYRYEIIVRPWLWLLTRNADCRIFQNQSTPDIIKAIFGKYPDASFDLRLTASYNLRDYCVQYRETDFDFVSRLMEEEGIYYFFTHAEGKHTLVLGDSISAHDATAGYEELPFLPEGGRGRAATETVSEWSLARQISTAAYVLDDFDFERPHGDLMQSRIMSSSDGGAEFEFYDYPGRYVLHGDGHRYAQTRLEELRTPYDTIEGRGAIAGLACGALFKLADHPREDQNREYLITATEITLAHAGHESRAARNEVSCRFSAMPSAESFRPERRTPKGIVRGPQTAIVVGPAGDEIHTDKYGRVKVQFHWDRLGKKDAESSCWIRVSHPWAGKNWGMIAIPRIGQEVIVDFLEGDPDRPIITGRVYNAVQLPPYALPGNMTQTGIKTRSSKGGTDENFNEIRFEDKKGSEQLFIHAEKNQDIEVENDETHWVGNDRAKTIDHDEIVHVKHDRTEQVDNNERITIGVDQTESIGNNRVVSVGVNHSETIGAAMSIVVGTTLTETVGVNYAETVGGAMELTVGAALAITVGAAMAETVGAAKTETVGGSKSESIGANRTQTVGADATETVGGNLTVSVAKDAKETVGGKQSVEVTKEATLQAKKVQITADDEISFKTGSAEIIMKKNGDITIKGGKITVKGSGDVVVKGSKIAEN